jgi:hypothetical protein
MPQIFHRSMNTISRVSIFGGVLIVASAFGIGGAVVRSPYATEAGVIRPQPVPFSHKHHVGDVGIDCRYCHRTVETDAFAGMPSTEVCLDCHSQLWRDSPMLAAVHASFDSGRPLTWTRVHDLPDFAYFHHGVHVAKGIACETCHGPVDQMPLMWREQTLHMEWCLECHREPEQFVRPRETVLTMGWKPTDTTPIGTELMQQYGIRSQTNCSVCHR